MENNYVHTTVHSYSSTTATDTIMEIFNNKMPTTGIRIYRLREDNCPDEIYNLTKNRLNTLVIIKADPARGFCLISSSNTANQYLYYTTLRNDYTTFNLQTSAINLVK